LRELQSIIDQTAKAQRQQAKEFQRVLNELAGTARPTVAENLQLLNLIRDCLRRLCLALTFGKGKSKQRVVLTLSVNKGALVGTFQIFTPGGSNRKYLYNGAEFPVLGITELDGKGNVRVDYDGRRTVEVRR
jgi:hypothetical protein